MAPRNKTDDSAADTKALQAEIDAIKAQLAEARASADADRETFAKEKGHLEAQRAQLNAEIGELRGRLDQSHAEQAQLASALEAARNAPAGDAAGDAGGSAAASAVTGPAISVQTKRGRQQIRYRAGRAFGPEPVVIALADLSEDDLAKIRGDAELVVTDIASQEA